MTEYIRDSVHDWAWSEPSFVKAYDYFESAMKSFYGEFSPQLYEFRDRTQDVLVDPSNVLAISYIASKAGKSEDIVWKEVLDYIARRVIA